jgi:hypothetical protein
VNAQQRRETRREENKSRSLRGALNLKRGKKLLSRQILRISEKKEEGMNTRREFESRVRKGLLGLEGELWLEERERRV